MTWRTATWARWVGWTALYWIIVGPFFRVIGSIQMPREWWGVTTPVGQLLVVGVPALIAFWIGVRFRSWWWGLGPVAVPLAAFAVVWIWSSRAQSFEEGEALGWVLLVIMMVGFHVVPSVLAALAGVAWGTRRARNGASQ